MRNLAALLGMEGVSQRAPVAMDTSRLVPTISVPGPRVPDEYKSADLVSAFIAGMPDYYYQPLGINAGSADTFATPQPFTNIERPHWIRQCKLILAYNAAGAAADAGRYVRFLGNLLDFRNARLCPVVSHVVEIVAGLTVYEWDWPECNIPCGPNINLSTGMRGWNGYVPPGYQWQVGIEYYVPGGAPFPLGTSVNGNIVVSEPPEGFHYSGPT